MRRKDREQKIEFALEVTDKCEWAALSMITQNGDPYCVPVSIVRQGMNVYFHCAAAGTKTDCLNNNSKVCLVCVGDTQRLKDEFSTLYESSVIKGNAVELQEAAEKIGALKLLCLKYTPENMSAFDEAIEKSLSVTAVWKIEIKEITGKQKK